MSAYTSQRWSASGSSGFSPDMRGPHDVDRRSVHYREFRSEHGDYGKRQNGMGPGENYHGRDSPSPMTSGESPAYNRSVCDSEEFGRHSPVPYPLTYSPPPPPPPDISRRIYHNYNAPHPPRHFHQRRTLLHPYEPPPIRGDPPPMRGGPWGPPPRGRRPFMRNDGFRSPFPRSRSPILRKPIHHGVDQQFDNFHERSYSTGPESSGAPGESNGPPPCDPRLNRSTMDKYPSRNSNEHDRKKVSRVLIPFTVGDQVNKEHSYCERVPNGGVKKQTTEPDLKPLTDPTLPRTHLSFVPKKFRLLNHPFPTKQPPPIFIAPTAVLSKPLEADAPPKPHEKRKIWPVDDRYPDETFCMDLELDEEDDSDTDSSVEGVECHLSLAPKSRALTNGLISKPSVHGEGKDESSEQSTAGKPAARRSKRLAQALDDSPCNESPEIVQSLQDTSMEDGSSGQEIVKDIGGRVIELKKSRRKKRLFTPKPSEKKKKQLAKKNAAMKNGLSNELKLLLSGDFRPEILTTRSRGESLTLARRQVMEEEIEQHERERIQTARAETETEAEEEELISHTHLICTIDTMDDQSSEHSATLTSSSTMTVSYDLGSSSHDQDSLSQDLDSISLPLSDSKLDEFPPELIARCKRITSAKSSGDTPLHKVCRNGRLDMVQCLLLALKVSPNTPDNAGWTPLHEACSNNRLEIAMLLLKNGADANASARDGTRPIHDAIEIGALEVVKLLVEYGADPTAELGDKSPLDLAKTLKTPEMLNYLQPVVKEHQDRIRAQKATSAVPATRRSTRVAVKHLKKLNDDDSPLILPLEGYSSDDPSFGQELDYPLFYICPTLELSESAFLPVYSLEIVSGSNPRRHNFYLLTDLLDSLCMTESELRHHCSEISALEMTVGEFLRSLSHQHYNKHVLAPTAVTTMPTNKKIKFLPACYQLQRLLDIQAVNLDD